MRHVITLSIGAYFPDVTFIHTKKHFYFPAYICAAEHFLIHIFMPEESYIHIFVIYVNSLQAGAESPASLFPR